MKLQLHLLGGLVLVMGTTLAAADNLIPNGDFSRIEAGRPDGWAENTPGRPVRGGVSADKTAWEVAARDTVQTVMVPEAVGELSGVYTFKGFYQADQDNLLSYRVVFSDENGNQLQEHTLALPRSEQWIAFFDQYDAPDGTAECSISFDIAAGKGVVRLDDISLRAGSLRDFAAEFAPEVPKGKAVFPIFSWHPPLDYDYLKSYPEIRTLYNSPRMHAEYAYMNHTVWGDPVYGLKRIIWSNAATADDAGDLENIYAVHGRDEPRTEQFPELVTDRKRIAALIPGAAYFNNLYPVYGPFGSNDDYLAHLVAYRDTLKPRMVTYDYYGLHAKSPIYSIDWWTNLYDFQEVFGKSDIPWGVIMVAMQFGPNRNPTEGELRWQAFTALAYGARILGWFTFQEAITSEFQSIDSPIRRDGTRSKNYALIRKINGEILQLGPTLLRLKNTGTFHSDPLPPRPDWVFPLKDSKFVRGVSGGNLVAGEFVDPENSKSYLLLVNRDFAAPAQMKITLAPEVTALSRLSTHSGKLLAPVQPGADNSIEVEFAAGDGKLFELTTR